MLKRVKEDWSFFNRAVREKAEGKPRPEAPPLKLVRPERPPASNKPEPPAPPPMQPSPVATAAPASLLVTPEPPPAANNPAFPVPPVPPAAQQPAARQSSTINAGRARPPRLQPLGVGRVFGFIAKLLLGMVAIVMLIAFIEAAWRSAHPNGSAAMTTGPGIVANGTAAMDGTEKVVTDYTTFNTVAYRSWKVVTGWRFENSHATQPNHQYCYLEVLTTGGQQIYTIAERDPVRRHDMPEALIPGLDNAAWDEAATKCWWHD